MPETIESIIDALEVITDQAIADQSPDGYFASLYCRVTREVRDAIHRNEFLDNKRMEQLDVVFANRYLEALRTYRESGASTRSWQVAFKQKSNPRLIVLQHLLLGMNAHINLDLGIAASEVYQEANVIPLKADFFRINDILGNMIEDTQRRLTYMFGPLGLIDRLLGSVDERLSLFSISYARDKAWNQTLELILATPDTREAMINERDENVAAFAQCLIRPRKVSIRLLLGLVRMLERGNTVARIRWLRG